MCIMELSQHTVLSGIRYNMGKNIKPLTINNYASFFYVQTLEKELGDSLFSRLRSTFLGPIIEAGLQPIDGLVFSAKSVHFVVSRRIMTTQTFKCWFRFSPCDSLYENVIWSQVYLLGNQEKKAVVVPSSIQVGHDTLVRTC
ncbi:hypothetical protein F2Q69_00016492 [Brassica cretica]|uniref:Uncharacterized protein n=1 Tax=Brassica cretica TaxID=69181 RepID=A0A8S9R2J1_BRACR|nr:hypothetical protein F2Q69_00016492 [Brassica cretica]